MDISLSRKTPPKEMDKASDCDGVTADTLFRLARVELVGMVKDDRGLISETDVLSTFVRHGNLADNESHQVRC
jgi:hypothetical protein